MDCLFNRAVKRRPTHPRALALNSRSGTLVSMQRALFLCLFSVLSLVGCSKQGFQTSSQEVLAKVNGEPVLLSEFLVNFGQLKAQQDEISQTNPKLMGPLKSRALNEVLILALLKKEAAKKQLRVAKEEVEGRLSNWKDGYPPGGFEEMLRKQNTTEDFLRKRISDQLLVEKLTETLFGTETMVSDEEMQNYYKQHQPEFLRPARIHALQIVVPTAEEAAKIRQEIVAGQITFESAARKYSLSPDAAKGGDLGFFSKDEKIAAFNKAFSQNVGEISAPIQSAYGIHLLKVVEKQPSKKLAFQEAKEEVVKAIKKQKEVTVYKEWVTKMLKDSEIYRNEALFASVL
jgi:parvulin-like peptidyl-prolyl isomerase